MDQLLSGLVQAFGAKAGFIARSGADGQARSVAVCDANGPAKAFTYALADAGELDVAPGEVRVIDGFPGVLSTAAPELADEGVTQSLIAPLIDARGERMGAIGILFTHEVDETLCPSHILRLIAGRIAGELERRESADRFAHLQTLLTNSAERIGLWEHNLQTKELAWSSETFRILGVKPHSVHPTREWFLSLVHPEDRERPIRACDAAIRSRGSSEVDYRVVRPDGVTRRILARFEVAPDIAGNPGWVFGTLRDVTVE